MNTETLFRAGYILILILVILSLVHYHFSYVPGHISVYEFLSNPQSSAGLKDSLMGSYSHSTGDGFVMVYNHQLVRVHYTRDYTPPRFGEVLVYGVLNSDGSVTAIGVHNYQYNYFIYAASGIAGIMIIIYFLREWKITGRGVEPHA